MTGKKLVTTAGQLSCRDYERILDLVVSALDNCERQPAWQLILEDLVATVQGTMGVVANLQWRLRTGHMVTGVPAWLGQTRMDSLIGTYMLVHPLMRLYADGAERIPLILDDVADRQWYRSDAYHAGREAIGVTRQIALPLPSAPGIIRTIVIGRSGENFTDRDREIICRLQSPLARIDSHARELERLRRRTPPANDPAALASRSAQHGITPRELTVLGLLAEGLTAAAIARRLSVSPHTVTKHQENLYRKLKTRDRLATVVLAQTLGIIPPSHR